MPKKKFKIHIKKGYKTRVPYRPTQIHQEKKKYTRKGRLSNRRHKELLREWQQTIEE